MESTSLFPKTADHQLPIFDLSGDLSASAKKMEETASTATEWTNPPLGPCLETIMQLLNDVDIAACRAVSKEWKLSISQTLWELKELDTTGIHPRFETLTTIFPNLKSLSLSNIAIQHINQLPVLNNLKLIKLKLSSAPTKRQLSCKLLAQLSSVQELSLHNFILTDGKFLKELPTSIIKLIIDNCVVEVEEEREDRLPPTTNVTKLLPLSSLQSLSFTSTIKVITNSTTHHQHTDNEAYHDPYYYQDQQHILSLLPPASSPSEVDGNNTWTRMKTLSFSLGAVDDNTTTTTTTLDQICLNIAIAFPQLLSLHMEASPFLHGSRLSPSGIEALPHLLTDLKILDRGGVVSGSALKSIAKCLTHLKTLDIRLEGNAHVDDDVVNAASLRELSALQHLTSLSLTSCDMSLSVCQNMAKLTALQHLELCKCHTLQDCGLFVLGASTTSLTSLALPGCCSITDIGIVGLAKQCRNLQSLDLTGCHRNITDTGLAALGCNLTRLTSLSLAHCEAITDAGLEAFLLTSAATSHYRHHQHQNPNHHQYNNTSGGGRSPLKKLNISDCFRLTDRSAFLLAYRAPALEWLSVEHCPMIADRGLTALCCRLYSSSQSLMSTPFRKKHCSNKNNKSNKNDSSDASSISITKPDTIQQQHSIVDTNNMCRSGTSSLTEVYTFGSGVSHEGVENMREVMRRKIGRPIRLYTSKSCWWDY